MLTGTVALDATCATVAFFGALSAVLNIKILSASAIEPARVAAVLGFTRNPLASSKPELEAKLTPTPLRFEPSPKNAEPDIAPEPEMVPVTVTVPLAVTLVQLR